MPRPGAKDVDAVDRWSVQVDDGHAFITHRRYVYHENTSWEDAVKGAESREIRPGIPFVKQWAVLVAYNLMPGVAESDQTRWSLLGRLEELPPDAPEYGHFASRKDAVARAIARLAEEVVRLRLEAKRIDEERWSLLGRLEELPPDAPEYGHFASRKDAVARAISLLAEEVVRLRLEAKRIDEEIDRLAATAATPAEREQ